MGIGEGDLEDESAPGPRRDALLVVLNKIPGIIDQVISLARGFIRVITRRHNRRHQVVHAEAFSVASLNLT